MSILVLHGPNLNLLGTREPGVFGMSTLPRIDADLTQIAANAGARSQTFQGNHEGALIDRIHAARDDGTGHTVINPGGLTHTGPAHDRRHLSRPPRVRRAGIPVRPHKNHEESAPMDLRKLKTLIDLVSESNISELEITEAEGKVRIVKAGVAAAPAATPDSRRRLPQRPQRRRRPPWRPPSGRRGAGGARGQGHQVAHGRHLLPRRQPRRQGLRRTRRRQSRKASRSASSRR